MQSGGEGFNLGFQSDVELGKMGAMEGSTGNYRKR